jgi:hypothetical protein
MGRPKVNARYLLPLLVIGLAAPMIFEPRGTAAPCFAVRDAFV